MGSGIHGTVHGMNASDESVVRQYSRIGFGRKTAWMLRIVLCTDAVAMPESRLPTSLLLDIPIARYNLLMLATHSGLGDGADLGGDVRQNGLDGDHWTLRLARAEHDAGVVKSWSCTHLASIRFLLIETRMFGAPEGGEIIEPGGVSPGVTRRTGEPILSSPRMGAASHRLGRAARG